VAAAFGHELVFDVDADDASRLEVLHHVVDRHGVAVTGVRVGHERDRHAAGDIAAGIDVVAQAEDADVGLTEHRVRKAGASRRRRAEAHRLNQERAVAVVDAGRNDRARTLQALTQLARLGLHLRITLAGCGQSISATYS
jgi:hypothetical protein